MKHFRTCHICEAMCGVVLEVEEENILSVRGDADDPFSRGHICPKALALKDIHNDPDRLKTPLRRTKNGWEEIGWEEAFSEVAQKLTQVQKNFGRQSVGIYQGNPTVHNYGALLFSQFLLKTLRSRKRFSATSVDQLPQMLASYLMFGHQLLMPVPDIDRTDFFLVLGANPLISNGSLMTAPDIGTRLKDLKKRGGSLVVLDPRFTETAKLATEHCFITPESDALFLLAFVHTIFDENLQKPGRLASFTDGFSVLRELTLEFSPESVSEKTGIPSQKIREIVRNFCQAARAICYGRVGISTQSFGGLSSWLVYAINILTGNLDSPGGMMFTTPAFDLVATTTRLKQKGHFGVWKSRVRGLPEFGGELPVAVLAEEILTPGSEQIRALITNAGNPVLSTPNGNKLEEALQTLDFMVSIDIYLNETTKHAHIILPPTFGVERDHYDIAFHVLAIRNTTKYSKALFPKKPNTYHDWEIISELSKRLQPSKQNLLQSMFQKVKNSASQFLTPERILEFGLRTGPYGKNPFSSKSLSLQKLKENPHGIDLGPLEPRLPDRLYTKNQRISLTPEEFVNDIKRLKQDYFELPPSQEETLSLIGRRELRTNNSWLHNSHRMIKGKERCTLLIHPDDAEKREITNGQTVLIRSRVGMLKVPAELSDLIMPGVVCLPHGWGHHRLGIRQKVASSKPGVSINDLTDEARVDGLCGTASFSGTPVSVTAL